MIMSFSSSFENPASQVVNNAHQVLVDLFTRNLPSRCCADFCFIVFQEINEETNQFFPDNVLSDSECELSRVVERFNVSND